MRHYSPPTSTQVLTVALEALLIDDCSILVAGRRPATNESAFTHLRFVGRKSATATTTPLGSRSKNRKSNHGCGSETRVLFPNSSQDNKT